MTYIKTTFNIGEKVRSRDGNINGEIVRISVELSHILDPTPCIVVGCMDTHGYNEVIWYYVATKAGDVIQYREDKLIPYCQFKIGDKVITVDPCSTFCGRKVVGEVRNIHKSPGGNIIVTVSRRDGVTTHFSQQVWPADQQDYTSPHYFQD
jgi:hypothetical protein